MEPLDIDAMKKAAKESESTKETRPFLLIKPPTFNKKTKEIEEDYAYRVKIDVPESKPLIRQITGKTSQRVSDVIDVEVLAVINDDEAPHGKATMFVTHKVLRDALVNMGAKGGDIFDIMNEGIPKGKNYYIYTVQPRTGNYHALDLPLEGQPE